MAYQDLDLTNWSWAVVLKDNCMVSGLAPTFVSLVALTNKIVIQAIIKLLPSHLCFISKQHWGKCCNNLTLSKVKFFLGGFLKKSDGTSQSQKRAQEVCDYFMLSVDWVLHGTQAHAIKWDVGKFLLLFIMVIISSILACNLYEVFQHFMTIRS